LRDAKREKLNENSPNDNTDDDDDDDSMKTM
jgi:hypothetical protein